MEKKLNELREQLKTKKAALSAFVDSCGDDFSEDQFTKFQTHKSEIEALETKIEKMAEMVAAKTVKAGQSMKTTPKPEGVNPVVHDIGVGGDVKELRKINKSYSVIKALKGLSTGKLEGLEKEMHQLAESECKADGRELAGVGVPAALITKAATNVTTANQGPEWIPTELSDRIIGPLRPQLWVETLGVQYIAGLTGNLDIGKDTGPLTAAWLGEFEDAGETSLATALLNLRPVRMGSYTLS